jgi:hypothetical protein
MEEPLKAEEKFDEKKVVRQTIILLIILGLVLASFVGAYFMFKPKPYFMYNDLRVYPLRYGSSNIMIYSFPLAINIQETTVNQDVLIRNNPYDAENISYEVDKNLFTMAKMAFTMDSQLNTRAFLAAKEISSLAEQIKIPTVFGVTGNTENDILIFDCENATDMLRVVRMELGNETKVFSQDKCIIVEGQDYDSMMKAADKLVVEWLAMLKNNK